LGADAVISVQAQQADWSRSILRSGTAARDRTSKSIVFQHVFKKVHVSLVRSEQNKSHKEIHMNRIAAIALFVGATLMTASSATAQSNLVKVNVPFDFTVNNTFLPAGSYIFGFDSSHPDLLVIRDQRNAVRALDFGQRGSFGQGNRHALIFHRYGDHYFLSQVCLQSASDGIELSAAKSEKRARKVNRIGELASIAVY
jgi:hypothetical protein